MVRRAAWWVQLARESVHKPWATMALALVRHYEPKMPPTGLLCWRPLPHQMATLPPPIRSLLAAYRAIPPPQDVALAPLQPGAWCHAVALWHNPALTLPTGAGLEAEFWDVAHTPIRTLGDLLQALDAINHCSTPADFTRVHRSWLRLSLPASSSSHITTAWLFLRDKASALQRLQAVMAKVPESWIQHAQHTRQLLLEGRSLAPDPDATRDILIHRLGWPGLDPGLAFTVRAGTTLQLTTLRADRRQRFAQFEALAGGITSSVPGTTIIETLPKLWRLPCDNMLKEVFWRLVYDALPTAARMHCSDPCGCGAAAPGRQHHYWDCPVAAAVVDEVAAGLSSRFRPVHRHHIWLTIPPSPAASHASASSPLPQLHEGAWQLVSLAALAAMDHGRRLMHRRLHFDTPSFSPGHALAGIAARSAVARFWDLLQELCSSGALPMRWRTSIPSCHPYIQWCPSSLRWRVAFGAPVP